MHNLQVFKVSFKQKNKPPEEFPAICDSILQYAKKKIAPFCDQVSGTNTNWYFAVCCRTFPKEASTEISCKLNL